MADTGAAAAPPRLLPPHGLLLALLAQGVLGQVGAAAWLPGELGGSAPAWPGVLPLLGGIALMSWGASLFSRHKTPIRPLAPSTVLVVQGPYRFTRNPMYLGMLVVLVGVAWLLGSPWPWIVVPLFGLWLQRRFIRHEEALLGVQFGAAFEDYCSRVRRWV